MTKIKSFIPYNPVRCIGQTEEPKGLFKEKEKYEKNREDMYEKLNDYQSTAIINAEKLIKRRDELKQHPFDPYPSTTVHELVRELNKNSRLTILR